MAQHLSHSASASTVASVALSLPLLYSGKVDGSIVLEPGSVTHQLWGIYLGSVCSGIRMPCNRHAWAFSGFTSECLACVLESPVGPGTHPLLLLISGFCQMEMNINSPFSTELNYPGESDVWDHGEFSAQVDCFSCYWSSVSTTGFTGEPHCYSNKAGTFAIVIFGIMQTIVLR